VTDQRHQAIKQAGLQSRRAMVWLREHKLPADPICYTIAYEYLHSERSKMKQQIDTLEIEDDDYMSRIKSIYQQCIIAEDYEKLAMSGDVGNKYVSEILALLLPSQDKITDNTKILDAVNEQINAEGNSPQGIASGSIPSEIVESVVEKEANKDDYIRVAENASKDELTSALDFGGLKQSLISAIKYPDNFPISILRINIDRFKQFNDVNGKFMGDAVLKAIVKTLQNQLKGHDLVSRYESDEFIVLLPQTGVAIAVSIADKLRLKVSTLVLKKKHSTVALKFTVSIGVAEMSSAVTFDGTLNKTKKALSRSKDLGRNCVNKDD
jgi:diguanylate cyclase (GGDEF)-like protein